MVIAACYPGNNFSGGADIRGWRRYQQEAGSGEHAGQTPEIPSIPPRIGVRNAGSAYPAIPFSGKTIPSGIPAAKKGSQFWLPSGTICRATLPVGDFFRKDPFNTGSGRI